MFGAVRRWGDDNFAAPEQAGIHRKGARSKEYDRHGHDASKDERQLGIQQIRLRHRENGESRAQGAQGHCHARHWCQEARQQRSSCGQPEQAQSGVIQPDRYNPP